MEFAIFALTLAVCVVLCWYEPTASAYVEKKVESWKK